MKKKYYHGTFLSNLNSILENGLQRKWEGIYLTDSKESAFRWTALKAQSMGESVLVVEVEINDDNIVLGQDHSPMMNTIFGCGESYLFTGDLIASDEITNYYQYSIK